MKRIVIGSVLLGIASLSAKAATPTFDFVEVGYVTDLSGFGDFDGFEVKGNLEISDDLYLNAGFTKSSASASFVDLDLDVITLGLGYKTNISDVSTLFAEFDYLKLDSSFNGFGSDDGYQVGFGIRSYAVGDVELKAAGYYRDVRGGDSFIQVGGAYNLTESAGVYLDVETDFDDTGLSIGVRFSF